MSDTDEDAMSGCEGLAEPMGQLIGGAAAVPAFAGGALPFAEVPPAGVIFGSVAAYNAYSGVSEAVESNWSEGVCEPMRALALPDDAPGAFNYVPAFDLPPPPVSPPPSQDFVSAFPGGSDFGSAGTTTIASANFAPSPGGGYGGSDTYSGGGDSGGGSSSDGGSSSSD